MAYGIIIQRACQATNNDALNRFARCAAAAENGSVFNLLTVSSTAGEGEVFVATAPVTGSLSNLWMAAEPPVVTIKNADGTKKYLGIDPDPRDFNIAIGDVFTVFQPRIGDIIELSADAVEGTKSTNEYVVATNTKAKLQWASAAVSGLSLKLLGTTKIAIGDGTIAQSGVTGYRFEVVAVA